MTHEELAAQDAKVALPADIRGCAERVRRWTMAVKFPSDGNFREDLLYAAALLDRMAATKSDPRTPQ